MTTRASPPQRDTKVRAPTTLSHSSNLKEVAETLEAIRAGDIDALVVRGPDGEQVFTLEGADHGYRVLLEVMSEGVAKVTQEGMIAYCNARFAAILGMPLERMIWSSIHDFLLPDEHERFATLLHAGAHERTEGEFRLRAPGALDEVPVLLSVVPLTMRGRERHCLVITDLTEQKRHSDEMAAERAAMQTRLFLADRMASLGTLAAGVAHEINNPLAYVLASLELMIGRLPDCTGDAGGPLGVERAWWEKRLERAHEGTTRVRVIVRDLKAFSRADDDTLTVVDLGRALDSSVGLASNEIRHCARLVRDYKGLPKVRANEARLTQVFVNLLINAAQAIAPGAADKNEIRISGLTDDDGHAVIAISDTGAGIAEENLGRVFEPFFTTKAVGMGTGLGLALCHGIVTSFGGLITVESAPGKGSVFRIRLPPADAESRRSPSVKEVATADSRGRLLVIDDEPDLCETLQELLAQFHDVVTTTDAHRALEWVAAGERFDMVFCDMRMPEMTGLDFYMRLLAMCPEQASRMVLMSGGFTRPSGELPLALPAPILQKPFAIDDVRALMRETLRRGPRPSRPRQNAPVA